MRRYDSQTMIRYKDYKKPEGDVVIRDGKVVPVDHKVALEMAQEAHMLAGAVRSPDAPKPASAPPDR